MRTKIVKYAHDAKASILSGLGVSLRREIIHPQIFEQVSVQQHSKSIYTNSLEDKYYGTTEQVVYNHPSRNLYAIKDVWVTGSEAHIFFDQGNLFSVCPTVKDAAEKKIRRPIPRFAKRVESPVLILASRAPGNRAHFLFEHLPRLIAGLKYLKKNPDYKVLVTPNHRTWQYDYLKKFDISSSAVVEGSEGSVFCKTAICLPLLSEGGTDVICAQHYYETIRRKFCVEPKPERSSPAIFLSRQDAATRRLVNEDHIFEICKRTFPLIKKVTMGKLSLAEQIQLFQFAEVVIGPHGQPFRNSLFSSNALFIQLVPGARGQDNAYHRWGRNFNCLGTLGNNHCISLYSEGLHEDGASHWTYDPDKFKSELPKILTLRAEIVRERSMNE